MWSSMDIKSYILDSIETKTKILNDENIIARIEEVANVIVKAYKDNKKVLTAGNGGSAGDAQHIVGELISKVFLDRSAFSAIALTTDTSVITAVSNDFGYEEVFARQLQANANSGDVFIAISTSGNSTNIINAFRYRSCSISFRASCPPAVWISAQIPTKSQKPPPCATRPCWRLIWRPAR